ncbi:MAG: MMPL family transporter [Nocardiaceae bacterium]|nr:MMPL family transporter [Nocardiaceae bacterium]
MPQLSAMTRTAYVVLAPGTPGEREIPILGRLYVGRECAGIDEQHRLILTDPRVSRLHLEITIAGDGSAWVTDRSANGTTLNGTFLPVTGPVALRPGDRLGLGAPVIEYRVPPGFLMPPPDGIPYFVEIREPDRPIRLRVIEGPLEIGRDCPGELVEDRTVSRSHLKFIPRPGSLTVADLGGRNGTFVNGMQLIEPVTVRPNDVLRIGRTELVLLAAQRLGPPGAPATPLPPAPAPSSFPPPLQSPYPQPPFARPAPPIQPQPTPGQQHAAVHVEPVRVSGGAKFAALLVMLFVIGIAMFGLSLQPKLAALQSNDPTTFLPGNAESTIITKNQGKFFKTDNMPEFVLFQREGGLTDADREHVTAARDAIVAVKGVDTTAAQLTPIQFSKDQTTAAVVAPLILKEGGKDVSVEDMDKTQEAVISAAKSGAAPGLTIHTGGPAAVNLASNKAFSELDGPLLFTTLGVVVVILLLVYRSPTLLFVPLICSGFAIGCSSLVVYLLTDNGLVTLTGIAQAILWVLVLGAGTDYALLLIARYREELYKYENRFEAMYMAWKESAEAIVASAGTASAGLLCMVASDLKSNQGLGPVAAAGVGATLLVMMTVLPVLLALLGRWIFWPNIPRPSKIDDLGKVGLWGKISDVVVRHRRAGWIWSTLILLVAIAGITSLHAGGLSSIEQLRKNPDAVVGTNLFNEKFPEAKGSGQPALILTDVNSADAVITAAQGVKGVATTAGSVCIALDSAKASAAQQGQQGQQPPEGQGQQPAEAACAPPELQVQPVDGRTIVSVNLADPADSPEALETIKRLRTAVHAVSGANAEVGGTSAQLLDIKTGTVSDRNHIIPLVLFVIFCILMMLLRAIAAPIVLILTVVLSFGATLGVSGLVFEHVFKFPAADSSFPLFAFVFLVALGVDYNIFLMTRVRQEARLLGTRSGIRRGLTVTGGVITSAGVILAATFAVLITTPLVVLAEVGFAVAFGVLLDTLIVRTILVPALAHEIGRGIWWPSKLRKGLE